MKTYDELLAERDALAAQAETLKSLFPLDCLVGCDGMLNYPIKKYNNVVDAFNSAPQQCLAEIKAEAIESLLLKCIYSEDHKVEIITKDMVKYNADKVRKGGAL